jgi:flagellar motor switch/type III secretory pathway protein FliN
MRNACLWLALLLALVWTAAPQAQTAPSLALISAKRAKSYATRTGEIRPRDEATDVVVVIRITGLPIEDFRRLSQDSVVIVAGTEDLPATILLSGVIDGRAELKAVVVGPKNIQDMQIRLSNLPPFAFHAEDEIAEQLR